MQVNPTFATVVPNAGNTKADTNAIKNIAEPVAKAVLLNDGDLNSTGVFDVGVNMSSLVIA
jgi:hypothetical protein